MNNIEREKLIDYDELKTGVLRRVNDLGSLEDMDSWKKAYPEIEFTDEFRCLDENGNDSVINIDWNERTLAEKIFFVAMRKSSAVEISYDMVVEDEVKVTQKIDDPEKIWQMWLGGCFSGEDLKESALWLFVESSHDGGNETLENKDDVDLEKFEITRLDAKIRPF